MKNEPGLVILLIALIFVFLFMGSFGGYGWMWNMMGGSMFFGGWLIFILVIVFLVLGISWFAQQLRQSSKRR